MRRRHERTLCDHRERRQPGVLSSYALGEHAKVVLLTVTEGDDKPLKYPGIFTESQLCVINKIDLLPYVPFDIAATRENARKVHPGMDLLEISCTMRQGLAEWLAWICRRQRETAGVRAWPTLHKTLQLESPVIALSERVSVRMSEDS